MKTRYPITVFSILSLLAFTAPQSSSAAVTTAPATTSTPAASHWSEKMQGLYHTLSSLMTDVSSDERFKNPKNRAEIERNSKKLADLAHSLRDQGVTPPDKDPSVGIFAALFADEAKQAYHSIRDGNTTYGRELLRSIPGYCIACHTRNNTGPDFAKLPIEPTTTSLRSVERGEFYAATRQYDRALKEFNSVIANNDIAATRPVEWSHAIKYALAIAVRVKQDPHQAHEIVLQVVNGKFAPFYMKEDAKRWLESIDAWSKEPKQEAVTEEGLYSEAVRLLGNAHEVQKYPADHSADILYLRASAAVHDLLQLGPNGRHAGEGYLIAGICYEVLSSFHIGEVQDIYYEVCVRTNPHTSLATACYHRLQESIFDGFTGSGGTYLPEDEKQKLKALEEMATPPPAPVPAVKS